MLLETELILPSGMSKQLETTAGAEQGWDAEVGCGEVLKGQLTAWEGACTKGKTLEVEASGPGLI